MMYKIISKISMDIINIIESKPKSLSIAHQFIYEELESAFILIESEEKLIDGLGFLEHRISNCGIDKRKVIGAIDKSWIDVNSPKEYLISATKCIREMHSKELSVIFRISVIDNIMANYKMGIYNNKNLKKQKKKDINLFKPLVNQEEQHSHFKYLLKKENYKIKDILTEWAIGFKDRDNKFIKEFQKTFNSSFWELYIYKCLRELSYQVDFEKSSPDFISYTSYSTLCIEATTANEAKDDDPEWTKESLEKRKNKSHKEFLNYATFRLLTAITSKGEKYKDSYMKLEHVQKKPFIIAVAPFEQSMFSNQNNNAINRVLYAKGFDDQKMCEVNIPYTEKNDGTKLELGIFRNDKYSDISAIIFSTTATISKVITQTDIKCKVRTTKFKEITSIEEMKDLYSIVENIDYKEEILDGLQVHHNPYAKIPLDTREFDNYYITHYFYNIEDNYIIVNQNKNTLVSRNTIFELKDE